MPKRRKSMQLTWHAAREIAFRAAKTPWGTHLVSRRPSLVLLVQLLGRILSHVGFIRPPAARAPQSLYTAYFRQLTPPQLMGCATLLEAVAQHNVAKCAYCLFLQLCTVGR